MPRAFIGIGSNIGNRIENCARAVELLSSHASAVELSSVYSSEPVGLPNQPDFINLVAMVKTHLNPYDLLGELLYIERRMGRVRKERWGPRVIDLDLLFYEDLVISDEGLILPHPRAHERGFVLVPLCEIAPRLRHPVLGACVEDILLGIGVESKKVVKLGRLDQVTCCGDKL